MSKYVNNVFTAITIAIGTAVEQSAFKPQTRFVNVLNFDNRVPHYDEPAY